MKAVPSKAAAAAGEQYERIQEEAEALTEMAEKKLYQMGATTRELAHSAEEKLQQYSSGLENGIKERPLLSIGIAALVGALLLKVFTRDKH